MCVRVKCQYIHTVDLQFTYSAYVCVWVNEESAHTVDLQFTYAGYV